MLLFLLYMNGEHEDRNVAYKNERWCPLDIVYVWVMLCWGFGLLGCLALCYYIDFIFALYDVNEENLFVWYVQ